MPERKSKDKSQKARVAQKTTAKKSAGKRSTAITASSSPASMQTSIPKRSWLSKKTFIIIFILIVLAILAYRYKGLFIAATVNGQPISRFAVISQLEHSSQYGGKQALNDLITQTLVLQEASKEHISVSQSEIDAQIKQLQTNLSKQGQNLDQLLSAQGLTRKDLQDRIRLQTIINKKFEKNVSVSDKEIDDYVQQNKDQIPANADMNQYRTQAKTQIQQQKIQQKVQDWIQSLEKNAKINYFVQY